MSTAAALVSPSATVIACASARPAAIILTIARGEDCAGMAYSPACSGRPPA
jgi:hypothetical protein